MKQLISTPLIGSDPELFIFDKINQRFKSSIGLIGGGKFDPRPLAKGFYAQEDNVLVEFNIPPSQNKQKFVENIIFGKEQIEKLLGPDFELRACSSAFLPMEELMHPQANEFGCNPDNNAWNNGKFNDAPAIPADGLRSAGGHIHIGFEPDEAAMKEKDLNRGTFNLKLIQLCDLYLGVPSILMDTDKERRKLYGRAGAFRHKPYGAEYRVLSSFWLESKKKIEWAYEQTIRAVERASIADFISEADGEEIQYTINAQSENSARELVDKYSLSIC